MSSKLKISITNIKIYQQIIPFFFIGIFLFFVSLAFGSDDLPLIVVDPGHGGTDCGATGYYKTTEKEISLSLSLCLKKKLAHKYHVILTRESDTYKSLLDRTATANYHQPIAFISLHVGASFRLEPEGIATYYWQPCNSIFFFDEDELAEKKYDNDINHPPLWDHLQRNHLYSSKFLAEIIHQNILSEVEIYDRKVRGAPIFVLTGADVPAILIETGYITQPQEENKLLRNVFLDKIAQGISGGLEEYLKKIAYDNKKSLQ